MRGRTHHHAVTLALASMLAGAAFAQSGGSMGLTITLRARPAHAEAAALEAGRPQSTELERRLAGELRRFANELERKYDAQQTGAMLSRLRQQTLVVSNTEGSPRPIHLPVQRATELRCAQHKCESL